jgi:hypothetical protein
MKLANILLNEISPELRGRAIQAMQDRGQERRADKWIQHYGTKDLEKFKGKQIFDGFIIYSFEIEKIKERHTDRVINALVISYGSPRHQEFNRTFGKVTYYPESDGFSGLERMSRRDARLLGQIAKTVNPSTKYAIGTGDFKIEDY